MAFRQLESSRDAFTIMGVTVMASSVLSLLIVIQGHDSVIFRRCGKQEEDKDEEIPRESASHLTPDS